MKPLILFMAIVLSACGTQNSSTQTSEDSCPVWQGNYMPQWLILQLDMAAQNASDVHQCSSGCGSAFYQGHYLQGCNSPFAGE